MDKGFEEKKFKRDGIEMPFQCILINAHKNHNIFKPHYHDYIEILYSINSDADIYINGKWHTFLTGDLAIVNSKETHDLSFERADAQYMVIKVSPEILYSGDQSVFEMKYLLPFIIENSRHERVIKIADDDRFIHDIMSQIMFEWTKSDYGYELAIRADILRVFLWILRHWVDNQMLPVDTFDYPDDLIRIVQAATEYVSKNYSTATAKEVAEYCNLSYSYFSRSFKKIMHQSFSEYLNFVRITKAEQMLSASDKSIADIADEVGFSTPSYFIQQFKKQKAVSPKQYRLNYTKS